VPNLHLETSWCQSAEVLRLLDEVGADRVLFGSDAATDGPVHFVRDPPNLEMVENYNQSLLTLARQLPPATTRALLEDNTRRLFKLPAARRPQPDVGAAEAVPGRPERAGVAAERTPPPAELFPAALAQAVRVVSRVEADQLRRSTPCAEWDVQALLGHLLSVVRRAERLADGRPATSVPDVAAVGSTGRWVGTFQAAASKAEHAWTAGAPAAVRAPWGRLPAPVALSGSVLELVAHTHDLAVATGQAGPLDEELAEAALRIAERLVPDTAREGGIPFAVPVPTAPDADAVTRLAGYLGRRAR
jgi:uncharacterized protein (TIGR03086 family)